MIYVICVIEMINGDGADRGLRAREPDESQSDSSRRQPVEVASLSNSLKCQRNLDTIESDFADYLSSKRVDSKWARLYKSTSSTVIGLHPDSNWIPREHEIGSEILSPRSFPFKLTIPDS